MQRGLAYHDGWPWSALSAIHRVLAFDLVGCEGVARGALSPSYQINSRANRKLNQIVAQRPWWLVQMGGLLLGMRTVMIITHRF